MVTPCVLASHVNTSRRMPPPALSHYPKLDAPTPSPLSVRLVALLSISSIFTASECLSAPKAVLWQRRPHGVSLVHGPGGPEGMPKPPFRWLKEEPDGAVPSVWVSDARSRTWIVQWSREAPAHLFASRLAWSVGYQALPAYFVRQGRILDAKAVGRAWQHIGNDGYFQDAHFTLMDPAVGHVRGGWRWDENPFLHTSEGRRQLNGLKILMLLLSNWDAKDARDGQQGKTAVYVTGRDAKALHRYAVDDWGAALGGWGRFFSRNRWDCGEFAEQDDDLVRGLSAEGVVEWGFSGRHSEDLRRGIRPDDVRWLLGLLGRTSDREWAAGLRASGATPEEAKCFALSLQRRIRALAALTQRAQPTSR